MRTQNLWVVGLALAWSAAAAAQSTNQPVIPADTSPPPLPQSPAPADTSPPLLPQSPFPADTSPPPQPTTAVSPNRVDCSRLRGPTIPFECRSARRR
ncbi:MAG TPA: hypothetical protein VL494_20005 [Steroidobacteraceae bacterium]|nr:hypothetical protein [Steroidobacteraceae bacterium]